MGQSGFRRGHSTETALLSVSEALRIAKADSKSSVLRIYLPLLTLSIIRFSWPPSHYWASLRWFESYLNGKSFKVAWGGDVSAEHQLVTVVPPGSVLGPPPLLHKHYITGSHHTSTWFLIPLLHWWHTALSLVSTRWSNGSCTDLRLPGGHLGMDEGTSPTAQPGKNWASCLPCHSNSTAWFHHPDRFINNYPIKFSQKYWCNFRWPVDQDHIAKNARSCRFALHNIRKIRSFLTQHAGQLLVQALVISRLYYCNALLAGLPSNTIKPLQMIQNADWSSENPKRAHVTSLFNSLHWLPVAARIQFKTLMLAYRTATGSAPSYFHSLMTIYIPSRSLRSVSERRLVVPSQRGTKSLSRMFSFTVPGWCNELPTPIRNDESEQFSSDSWKRISSVITCLHLKK